MVCCYQVTEIDSSRYGFAIASSARSPCNFGPLADVAMSVFREMSMNIPILDPALLITVPNIPHVGCVSNELHTVLSVELCNRHEVLLPLGRFQKDSLVLERLFGGLYLYWKFHESPL